MIIARFNLENGAKEKRDMLTGVYTVCDVTCHQCHSYLGWKYLHAKNYEEKYKEGKFVMESACVRLFCNGRAIKGLNGK